MSKIIYADKVALNANSGIADINKCNANDMNDLKYAVNEIGKYNTATAGTNGDFYLTLKGTLSVGDIVRISFPTATVPSANARLSIDGGVTYVNIVRMKSSEVFQFQANGVENSLLELTYDGANFVVSGGLSKEVFLTGIITASSGKITLRQNINHFDYILVATGSASTGNLRTSLARGWSSLGFRAGVDVINVTTNNGKCIMAVTNETTLTIQSTNDPVRYIIGCRY